MKKGIVFPAEFLIRLAIGIMFAVLIVIIGCNVFTIDTTSGAAKESFEGLIKTVASLGDGETRAHELVLREGNAIIAFTKTSEHIYLQAFDTSYNLALSAGRTPSPTPVFQRPPQCPLQKACICYCSVLVASPASQCNKDMICRSFDDINFPEPIQKKNFLSKTVSVYDYEFQGGFIIGYSPFSVSTHSILSIERQGNTVALCDHKKCVE